MNAPAAERWDASARPSLAQRLSGHLWTVLPTLRDCLRSPPAPPARIEQVPVLDDRHRLLLLTVEVRHPVGARDAVLLVHGLGGSSASAYVQRAAAQLHARGVATLAVNLRGADRRGAAFYHVAQHEDLAAVCASAVAAAYRRLFVIGFSMGGHVAIHFAATAAESRLAGVAAVCTPLDLHGAQLEIDRPVRAFYRHYVLSGLKQIYAAVARRHSVPSPVAQVLRCRTFHEWDRLTIAPRYGYPDPESFYRAKSAATVLPRLCVPTLLVLAAGDPLAPPSLSLPHAKCAAAGMLTVRVACRGGHLHLPAHSGANAAGGDVVAQVAEHWGLRPGCGSDP